MSTFKTFKKQNLSSTTDVPDAVKKVINTLQSNIEDSITPLNSKSQNDSVILTGVSLTSNTTNTVSHTLSQNLSGWRIVDKNAQADVWRVNNTTSIGTYLYLQCSADCIVNIEVF